MSADNDESDTDNGRGYSTPIAGSRRQTTKRSSVPRPPSSLYPPGSTKCQLALDTVEHLGAVSCGLDAGGT